VGRFLFPLAVSVATAVSVDLAVAGPLHLFDSQKQTASRAGVPTLTLPPANELLSGCGHGRYRDAATHRCRGPADVGN
jgi:hypothetical protein